MGAEDKIPLGQLLVEKQIITSEQLDIALRKQKETGELLGAILLGLGFVDEEMVFLPALAGLHSFKEYAYCPRSHRADPCQVCQLLSGYSR